MNYDDAQNELELIKRMVAESRTSTARAGDIYLVWGVGVLAALAGQWWMSALHPALQWVPWLAAGAICALYSFAASFFRRGDRRVVNFSTRVARRLWGVLAVAIWGMALLGGMSGSVEPAAVLPIVALMIGIGMAATGALFRADLFTWAGWLWLVGGLAAFFVAFEFQLLIFAGLDVLGYIVPGIYLMARERRRPENA